MTLTLDTLAARLSDEQTALAQFQATAATIQQQLDAANADVAASMARSQDLQSGIKIVSAVAVPIGPGLPDQPAQPVLEAK